MEEDAGTQHRFREDGLAETGGDPDCLGCWALLRKGHRLEPLSLLLGILVARMV
jgi:hypothetical protein